jgi:hypothetical protein
MQGKPPGLMRQRTFYQLIVSKRRKTAQGGPLTRLAHGDDARLPGPLPPILSQISSLTTPYWSRIERVKPANVLVLTSDDAGERSQGGALVITDGAAKLRFEPRGTKPEAVVLLGGPGNCGVSVLTCLAVTTIG